MAIYHALYQQRVYLYLCSRRYFFFIFSPDILSGKNILKKFPKVPTQNRKDLNMKAISGVYTSAQIFTTNNPDTALEPAALVQLQMLCDNPTLKDCKLRIMPDVHPGKVGTIGLTATIGNAIMPNLTGIDIGCGMTLAQITKVKPEYQKIDRLIRERIPSGMCIRTDFHPLSIDFAIEELYCHKNINKTKAYLSLGTLGGGNHFIEIDKDIDGNFYLIIHSGSRHLGKEVTEYYLAQGQNRLKAQNLHIPYELTYLEDELMEQYLHDVQVVQKYAALNRRIIIEELAKAMKWKVIDSYSSIHNYIAKENDTYLLRKGAISAQKGEKIIIPINMRDGVLLGTGLGNEEWNYSAPHGAGRILKRTEVKNHYTLAQYKKSMKGIYSSCITKDTLDESPFAYRSLEEITDVISETVSIENIIKPVYNFKAGSKERK